MSDNTSNDPWAWLGLLKWSLAYSDGTSPSEATPLSDADREFLEQVMNDGIINEGDRMKEILQQVTEQLELWKANDGPSNEDADDDEVVDLLQELRDLCEQIDYANAFCSLQGLPFLLGCIQETDVVPLPTRLACLGLLATLCQNNPPVQKQLLERGALKLLSDLYFTTTSVKLKSKLLQVLSAAVRSYHLAEAVFDQLEQSVDLIQDGLSSQSTASRALFFLRAFLTSDSTSPTRLRRFQPCLIYTMDQFLLVDNNSDNSDLRETSLELVQQILEQKKSVNAILSRKTALVGAGVSRVTALRRESSSPPGEEYAVEVDLWESVIQLLARTEPDGETAPQPNNNNNNDNKPVLAQ